MIKNYAIAIFLFLLGINGYIIAMHDIAATADRVAAIEQALAERKARDKAEAERKAKEKADADRERAARINEKNNREDIVARVGALEEELRRRRRGQGPEFSIPQVVLIGGLVGLIFYIIGKNSTSTPELMPASNQHVTFILKGASENSAQGLLQLLEKLRKMT